MKEPICPDEATAPVKVEIYDDDGQVRGYVYAEIVPLDGDTTGVRVCLRPNTPEQSITDLASYLGFHHFNWYQICDDDAAPTVDWLGNKTMVPYIDPPAMGYGPIIDEHGNTDGVVAWADCRPWYYDEVLPARDIYGRFLYDVEPWQYIGYQTYYDRLHFEDTPVIAYGQLASFKTWLVGVNADGRFARWFGGFKWTSTHDAQGRTVELAKHGDYPTEREYDWLIRRNKYAWKYDCTPIHFRPNTPINPPKPPQ